jgi:malate permease and related proteins
VNDVLEVLTYNILPIFLVAAVGFWLRRQMGLDKRTLSSLAFYALSPCLVFASLVNSQLVVAELTLLVLFTVVTVLGMGLVAWLAGRLLRLSRVDSVALLLAVMFVNGGNYGMTLNALRYGTDGLARAAVYYVTSTILLFTLGNVIALVGQDNGRNQWRHILNQVLRLPPLYAVILAVLVYSMGLTVPAPFMRAIEVTGAGAIPVMLVVLGMQMADMTSLAGLRLAVPASLLRLVLGPATAVLVAALLGLHGLSRSVSILEASMPTAVIITIVATEFDIQPAAITSTVVATTLLSVISLPLVIYLLGL